MAICADEHPIFTTAGGGQMLLASGEITTALLGLRTPYHTPAHTPALAFSSQPEQAHTRTHIATTPRSIFASSATSHLSFQSPVISGTQPRTNGEGVGGVTGECVRVLDGHSDAVYSCDWSTADGGRRFVLSGSGDATARVWDSDSGLRSCVRVLDGHSGTIW